MASDRKTSLQTTEGEETVVYARMQEAFDAVGKTLRPLPKEEIARLLATLAIAFAVERDVIDKLRRVL